MLTVIINRFSELQDRSQQQLFITHKCKIFVPLLSTVANYTLCIGTT